MSRESIIRCDKCKSLVGKQWIDLKEPHSTDRYGKIQYVEFHFCFPCARKIIGTHLLDTGALR